LGLSRWMAWSRKLYSPCQALSYIPRILSRSDFPAAEGPMMLMTSPSITSRSIPRSTSLMPDLSWKDFLMWRSRIMVDRSIVRRRTALRRSERPPEMRGQFNAETGAQPFHAFDILFGGHVSMRMPPHLGIGRQPPNWDGGDRPFPPKTQRGT